MIDKLRGFLLNTGLYKEWDDTYRLNDDIFKLIVTIDKAGPNKEHETHIFLFEYNTLKIKYYHKDESDVDQCIINITNIIKMHFSSTYRNLQIIKALN